MIDGAFLFCLLHRSFHRGRARSRHHHLCLLPKHAIDWSCQLKSRANTNYVSEIQSVSYCGATFEQLPAKQLTSFHSHSFMHIDLHREFGSSYTGLSSTRSQACSPRQSSPTVITINHCASVLTRLRILKSSFSLNDLFTREERSKTTKRNKLKN
jgi:hypothetical protein